MDSREAELLGPGILLAAIVVDVVNMGALADNPGHEEKGQEAVVQLVFRLQGLNDVEDKEVEVEPLNSPVSDSDSVPGLAAARKRHRSSEVAARSMPDLDSSLEEGVDSVPEADHREEERVLVTPPPIER